MLTLQHLTVAYGKITALHEVGLHVAEGEMVAILGANGAGKTTLLNAISGIVPARSSHILFQNQPLQGLPAWKIARAGIVQVPEGRKIFPKMSVHDNLEIGAFSQSNARDVRERIAEMERMFPLLSERRAQQAGTLSGGEQQMLAIARALMSRPKLLMLDEPSMGLAPLMVEKVFEVVRQIHAQGIAILLVEQNASRSLHLAHRAYVLETGRITLTGTGHELLENSLVQKAYLGVA